MQEIILRYWICREALKSLILPIISNDLSEVIRLTQENLEQESKRLHSILSYMTDGVLATNRRGKITMINDMAKKQLGVQKEEVLNKSILELLKIVR